MKKLTYICITITSFLFIGVGLIKHPTAANTEIRYENNEEELQIITVTKPQAFLVRSLLGGKHNIDYLIDENSNIENFEWTDEIVKRVESADLFMYSGAAYEKWINSFILEINKNNLGIIDLSRGIRTKSDNPYYWLGFEEYKISLYNAKVALQEKDPANREFYQVNYNDMIGNFTELLDLKKDQFSETVGEKEISYIVGTDFYDFFFESFGLPVEKIDEDNYKEKINSLIQEEKQFIVILDSSSEEKFDLTQFNVEPIYLLKDNYNRTFEDLILGNFDIIIDKIESN